MNAMRAGVVVILGLGLLPAVCAQARVDCEELLLCVWWQQPQNENNWSVDYVYDEFIDSKDLLMLIEHWLKDNPPLAVATPQVDAVTVDFYIGQCEVTQAQWTAVMGSDPVLENGYTRFDGGYDLPVYFVSWNDCQDLIAQLNTMATGTFCLAGGADYGCKPVGQRLPNPFGLFDMHGKVWEWCEGDWHDDYSGAPTDSAWIDQPRPEMRVTRGGSWELAAGYCRSTARYGYEEGFGYDAVGLRLVWEPAAQ